MVKNLIKQNTLVQGLKKPNICGIYTNIKGEFWAYF